MLPLLATAVASRTAPRGQGVAVSMWHTSAAGTCASVNTRKTAISICGAGEGEKRGFTVASRDTGSGLMRMTDG